MDQRTLWYALHRARRKFKRDMEKQARALLALPAIRPVDAARARNMLINPPIIFDDRLPNGGLVFCRFDRRLPS